MGEDEPLTAAEVAERIDPTRGWTLATVKTMLSRLAAKGAITLPRGGRRYLYSAGRSRANPMSAGNPAGSSIRLFGGRLSPLVARLAEEDALDEEDIAAIEAILKELKS